MGARRRAGSTRNTAAGTSFSIAKPIGVAADRTCRIGRLSIQLVCARTTAGSGSPRRRPSAEARRPDGQFRPASASPAAASASARIAAGNGRGTREHAAGCAARPGEPGIHDQRRQQITGGRTHRVGYPDQRLGKSSASSGNSGDPGQAPRPDRTPAREAVHPERVKTIVCCNSGSRRRAHKADISPFGSTTTIDQSPSAMMFGCNSRRLMPQPIGPRLNK